MKQPLKSKSIYGNNYVTGQRVRYGTPEYKEAYRRGEVVTNQGGRSPIELDNVVVKNNYRRNWLEEYAHRIREDNRNAGPLEAAVGVPVSAVTSFPQMMAMKAITGKVQTPSEKWGLKDNKDDSGVKRLAKRLGNIAFDTATDPLDVVAGGAVLKGNKIDDLIKLSRKGVPEEVMTGLRSNGALDKESIRKIMNAKVIPTFKKELPRKVELKETDDAVKLVGGNKTIASIHLKRKRNEVYPSMIDVEPKLWGNRTQDLLYDAAVKKVKKEGYEGLTSGDHLISPEKTKKAHERFNYVLKDYKGMGGVDVKTLTSHKNPNIEQEWFENYQRIPKNMEKVSLNDIKRYAKNNAKDIALLSAGTGMAAAGTDMIGINMFDPEYESRIIKWAIEKDKKNKKTKKK